MKRVGDIGVGVDVVEEDAARVEMRGVEEVAEFVDGVHCVRAEDASRALSARARPIPKLSAREHAQSQGT